MKLPVVVHTDNESSYGVTIPDIPGCFGAGDGFEAALEDATQAVYFHLEGLLEEGEPIPSRQALALHQTNPDYEDGMWGFIDIDLGKVSGKTKRVNITLPEYLLNRIDDASAAAGETRSGFLASAAMARMDR